MPSHHHRASALRQSNKKNKRAKSSKRSLSRNAGGKIVGSSVKHASKSAAFSNSKANRRHFIQQKRNASRQALLQKKRGIVVGGTGTAPPRLVGIISLGSDPTVESTVQSYLLQSADKVVAHTDATDKSGTGTTAKYNIQKKNGNLTFLTSQSCVSSSQGNQDNAAVMAALDLCRICHVVLFVLNGNEPVQDEESSVLGMHIGGNHDEPSISSKMSSATSGKSWDHLISPRGDLILTAIKAQGLPTPVTVLAHSQSTLQEEDFVTMQSAKSVRKSAWKRKLDLKKFASRFATTEFGPNNDKVMELDLTNNDHDTNYLMEQDEQLQVSTTSQQDASTSGTGLIRTLCNISASPPKWVADAPRSYLVSHSTTYNAKAQLVQLTGFVRGIVPWNVNSLVHVPQLGTFCCKHVQKAPHPLRHNKKNQMDQEEYDVLWGDPSKRESLGMFATPDALEGEQNLIGFDEEMESVPEDDEEELGVARPAGWSDYQSAWLDAMDNDMDTPEGEAFDHGELAKALNQKKTSSDMDEEDEEVSPDERKALVEQRRRDVKEDLEFPDEVEVQLDENARDRFARYRSLKSFRKSHWDPKENLPESYGSIFHFSSFKATQRDVMADMKDVIKSAAETETGEFWGRSGGDLSTNDKNTEMEDDSEEDEDLLDGCIPSGSYVTVTLEQVPPGAFERIANSGLVTAVTLLPHENKVSSMHMGLSHPSNGNYNTEVPVKSKDILTFRCGWRTWKARPVFSQNNLNSDKHKFERFLPQGGAFFAASVFGPVTYTPCPVLVFRESATTDEEGGSTSSDELIAFGSMLGADADRIVVKRIILTGYPVRVHKRHATVKYMFYNPDDVKWFKPAGLTTKHGLHGHIIESVGEHGTMKCLFNAPIKQHDTVCLPLYKRIFPKYAPDESIDDNGTVSKPKLVVL